MVTGIKPLIFSTAPVVQNQTTATLKFRTKMSTKTVVRMRKMEPTTIGIITANICKSVPPEKEGSGKYLLNHLPRIRTQEQYDLTPSPKSILITAFSDPFLLNRQDII